MKRILKVSSFLCLLLIIVGLAGCANKKQPQISNPNDAFAAVGQNGQYKVTNGEVYRNTRNSYGLDELLRKIDESLLGTYLTQVTTERVDELIQKAKFGSVDPATLTPDDTAKINKAFSQAHYLAGRLSDEDIRNYYKLEEARRLYGLDKFKADIQKYEADNKKDYFTDEQYESYFKANYSPSVDAIVVTFITEYEARKAMEDAGVKLNDAQTAWVKLDGTALTNAEIYEVFVEMYNKYNSYKVVGDADPIGAGDYSITDGKFTFAPAFLESVADSKNLKFVYQSKDYTSTSVIGSKLFGDYGLKVYDPTLAATDSKYTDNFSRTYTLNPSSVGSSKFYLMVKVGYGTETTLENVKAEIKNKLTENALTATEIGTQLQKMRREAGLVIYDYFLSFTYSKQDPDYKMTKKTSDNVVATYKVSGTATNVTADDLFTILAARHGAFVASDLLDRQALLNTRTYNDVFDVTNNKVLNKDTYNNLKKDVANYKTEFENNTYANYGFPSDYGWKEFMRDSYGVSDEEGLARTLALYDYTLNKYIENSFTYEDVETEMNRIKDAFFEANVISLIVFVDYDENNVPDKNYIGEALKSYTNWTDSQKALAAELITTVMTEKGKYLIGTNYAKAFNTVIEKYNNASLDDALWGKYKVAGLRLKYEATGTVNNNSSQSDEMLAQIKALWESQKAEAHLGLEVNPARWSDSFETPSDIRAVAITKTTDYTYADKSGTTRIILPTKEMIDLYKADPNDADLSTSARASIAKYYVTAVNNLKASNGSKTGRVNIRLHNFTKDMGVTFIDPAQLAIYNKIHEIYLEVFNESNK